MRRIRRLKLLPNDAVYAEMKSPVGTLTIITSPKGLHGVLWDANCKNSKWEEILRCLPQSPNEKIILKTIKQLTEYFQGDRKVFTLPLAFEGTDFQVSAWKQLLEIPYGKTISYGEQAERIGNKNKARAAGLANGLNPISIIVPCHRVIGSNGHLVGFAGGIEKKSFLLQLEAKTDGAALL